MTLANNDPHDLARFLVAQSGAFADALAQLQGGRKTSHWIWFIFPQIAGLGSSPRARFFAIASLAEARAYAAHPLLGERLRACVNAMLAHDNSSAREILGPPDDIKFRSCLTLFARACPEEPLFYSALARFFEGTSDKLTLERLNAAR